MQDIFISQQPVMLLSWSAAFPNALLAKDVRVPDACLNKAETGVLSNSGQKADQKAHAESEQKPPQTTLQKPVVFWLHMNQDRQQWLTNAIETIQTHYINAKIIVLANVPVHAEALYVLQLGAAGYSHAYVDPAVLKEIKTVITHGGLWIGQDILQRLIEVTVTLAGSGAQHVATTLEKLTPREKEVALEAAKGSSNKEIARVLAITERTVKAHLAASFAKIGAKDRLQLALMLNTNPIVKH